jgi:hypothetical protein
VEKADDKLLGTATSYEFPELLEGETTAQRTHIRTAGSREAHKIVLM